MGSTNVNYQNLGTESDEVVSRAQSLQPESFNENFLFNANENNQRLQSGIDTSSQPESRNLNENYLFDGEIYCPVSSSGMLSLDVQSNSSSESELMYFQDLPELRLEIPSFLEEMPYDEEEIWYIDEQGIGIEEQGGDFEVETIIIEYESDSLLSLEEGVDLEVIPNTLEVELVFSVILMFILFLYFVRMFAVYVDANARGE